MTDSVSPAPEESPESETIASHRIVLRPEARPLLAAKLEEYHRRFAARTEWEAQQGIESDECQSWDTYYKLRLVEGLLGPDGFVDIAQVRREIAEQCHLLLDAMFANAVDVVEAYNAGEIGLLQKGGVPLVADTPSVAPIADAPLPEVPMEFDLPPITTKKPTSAPWGMYLKRFFPWGRT